MSKYFKARPSTLLPNSTLLPKLILSTSLASMLTLTGCQTVSGLFGSDEEAVATISKSDAEYYREAVTALDKGQYLNATTQLTESHLYPTVNTPSKPCLTLCMLNFKAKNTKRRTSAEQFIKLTQTTPSRLRLLCAGCREYAGRAKRFGQLAGLNQAHRDTGYMRLAFGVASSRDSLSKQRVCPRCRPANELHL